MTYSKTRLINRIILSAILLLPLAGPLLWAAEAPNEHGPHDLTVLKGKESYQCSMHPWIVSDKPGNCPVCGMKLTKVRHAGEVGAATQGRAPVELSAERQQLIGVTKGEAAMRPLVYTVHSVGHVAYNPDVATAIAEYREAYAAFRKARGNPVERVREQAMRVMELAELKLKLAGMSSEQFEQVKNSTFDARILRDFFAPENLILPEGHVWIDTDLYENDSELVKTGDPVSMAAPALPGKIFEGVVRTSDALLNNFPRKLRVRIEAPHEDVLKPGMAVDVRIMANLGEKLSIPESALIDSGNSRIVFVDTGAGQLEPREVQIGQQADEYYEVIAGLHAGEVVVTSSAFLIDSEARLRAAAQGFSKKSTTEAAPASGHRH